MGTGKEGIIRPMGHIIMEKKMEKELRTDPQLANWTPFIKKRTNYWTCTKCQGTHNIATTICPRCGGKIPNQYE